MTNDKQVEVWRKQFQSLFDDKIFARGVSGGYINDHRNSMWQGFCLAKRSMQPIELPKKCESLVFQSTFNAYDVALAITEAGYSYRAKE